MHRYRKLFFLILLLALIIRLFLLRWSITYPLDINLDQTRYEDWAQTAHIYGLEKSYESEFVKTIPTRLPPGSTYLAAGTYEIYILIGKIINKITKTPPGSLHWVNNDLLHSIMRIPSIITDILTGVLIYLILKNKSYEKKALFASSLIWFNPIIIYNSTIWGQTDSIICFLMILAIYLAFRNLIFFSILSFCGSLYIKFTLLPIFPLFLFFLYFQSKRQWGKILVGVLTALLIMIAATYPISTNPISWVGEKLPIFLSGEMADISAAAFNFWWAVTCIPSFCQEHLSSNTPFLGVPLSTWAFGLFTLIILPLFYILIKKPMLVIEKEYLFLSLAMIAIISFLFLPRMHDRYLYPFFILFPAVIALSKHRKKYLIIFIILTVFHFINLLSSWYPTRYPSLYYSDIMYGHILRFIVSVLTLLVFIYFYNDTLKRIFKKNCF